MASKSEKIKVKPGASGMEGSERVFTPAVDIYEETDGTTVLVAELPGVKDDEVDIRVEKGVLTISADGSREDPFEQYTRTYSSFLSGEFFRAFALSDEVNREAIDAKLENGLLTIRLPRAEEAKTHKIEIK